MPYRAMVWPLSSLLSARIVPPYGIFRHSIRHLSSKEGLQTIHKPSVAQHNNLVFSNLLKMCNFGSFENQQTSVGYGAILRSTFVK